VISPDEVLDWTEEDYGAKLAGSAMKRATLDMWKRNARVVQQNARGK
jgi:epoxyqueuosine reductase QueG